MTKLEKIREVVELWLHRNHLHHDSRFYTEKEWAARKEEYSNGAELVMTTEGGLYMLLNGYTNQPQLLEEFNDLLESFGFYYELGYAWCMGFYSTEVDMECPKGLSYGEKLRDPRWTAKRQKVLDRAKGICEDCKKPFPSFEVHHCYYTYHCHPWQFPLDSLRALCRTCHESRGTSENKLMGLLARVDGATIDQIYSEMKTRYESRA